MKHDTNLLKKAVARMRAPAQMHIICIDITNKCDLKCSNCTRLLANQDHFWDMKLENFRAAVQSLRSFPGTIAVLGGNPCMHRDFESICKIIAEEVPDKGKRGLWTNNVFNHANLADETFGVFNLNPHNDPRGILSLRTMKHLGWYYEGNSEHSSLLASVKDFYEPTEMWDKIADCDINKFWSASIVENKGELRAYFCEVAASFDLARGTDHGIKVVDEWWKKPLEEFSSQISHFCPGCGVPSKIKGHMDHEETDTYSKTNADIAIKSATQKKRKIVEVKPADAEHIDHRVTTYSNNLVTTEKPPLRVGVVTPYYKETVEILKACHESVQSQTYACRHYLVSDGHPIADVRKWDVEEIRLSKSHRDNGNYARWIGAMAAIADGCDAICFLDADNWFAPMHIATMTELHRSTGAVICSAARAIHALDGEFLSDCKESHPDNDFIDTSCLFCTVDSFSILSVWGRMPKLFSPLADRVFWEAVRSSGLSTAHSTTPTVMFRSKYPFHYENAGKPVPDTCTIPADFPPALAAWQNLNLDTRFAILEGRTDAAGHIFPPDLGVAGKIKLGNHLFNAGNFDAAAQFYMSALRNQPLNRDLMNNLAVTLFRQGRTEEATALLSMIVAADPPNEQFRKNLEEVSAPTQRTILR